MRVCVCVRVQAQLLSHSVLSDSATQWSVACQSPPSIGLSRQEYWSGLPALLQGIFLTQGSNLSLLYWQVNSLPLHLWEASTSLQKLIVNILFQICTEGSHIDSLKPSAVGCG